MITKAIDTINASMRGQKDKKKAEEEMDVVVRCQTMLTAGQAIKDGEWSGKDIEYLNKYLFLTSKPVIFLANIGDTQYVKKQNTWLPKIQEHIKTKCGGGPMIPYSAEFES